MTDFNANTFNANTFNANTFNANAKETEIYTMVTPPQQNWGIIIGVGVVVLMMLVMVINLSIYKSNLSSVDLTPTDPTSPWVQLGRVAALLASLGGGGWLLRQLFRQQQSSAQTALKPYLQQAISYTQKIESLLKDSSKGHEQQLLAQIYTWWQTIEAMTQTLAQLGQNDHIIENDLHYLPSLIGELEQQLATESNHLLQTDLEQMLTQRQNQQQALEQLQTTRRRTEIQIERTISVLGTIYSQLLTYRSTLHVVDYQHLADNVAEEVLNLQDYLEALQEVKNIGAIPSNEILIFN